MSDKLIGEEAFDALKKALEGYYNNNMDHPSIVKMNPLTITHIKCFLVSGKYKDGFAVSGRIGLFIDEELLEMFCVADSNLPIGLCVLGSVYWY